MKLEYLVAFEKSENFCSDVNSIKNLLQSNSRISIESDKLTYKDENEESLTCNVIITTGEVQDKKQQRYILIELTYTENPENIEDQNTEVFNQVRRIVRKSLGTLTVTSKSASINTLWDDISLYYSKKSYPLIHQIENLMRKFITRFMFMTVGISAFEDIAPPELKKQVSDKKKNILEDALQELDFIQLSHFFFNKERTLTVEKLESLISKSTKIEDFKLENLKEFVPKSNWDRFFSNIIELDGNKLSEKWRVLYDLRCKVAHNKDFNKNDYEKVELLCTEISDVVNKAIEQLKLGKIKLNDEDVENVTYSSGKTILTESYPNQFHKISEEELIKELTEVQEWAKHADNFVSLKYFVMKVLGSKSYEYQTSYDMVNKMIQDGEIEVSQSIISPHTSNTVTSIRLKEKNNDNLS
ncbi:HEPN domain-containing protein [Nostoc sp. GT001]|uniref:HEPN domain-containing protein n=1 Tax=Nostoc sp. GT001 TaxID=3056647 RepID=UPI0025AAF525|nr:HEPN domain-containing protein [Nostoc sp. GT001]MDM9580570.1 HEPN domain-containing protein [Nostoc sp. GT001]